MKKMKSILTLIFLFAAFALSAQQQINTDSVQIKLEQYKKLYDSGVIGEEEYDKMKSQLTGAPVENKQEIKDEKGINAKAPRIGKADTMSLSALKERYHSRIIAGSVISSVGMGFIVGDILFATLAQKINPDSTAELSLRRSSEIALGVIGGVVSAGGALFLVLGLKDKAIYKRRGKELTLVVTGKEIGFAYIF